MTKPFTIAPGVTIYGPDDATQEQAVEQYKKYQAAQIQRDFQGPGHAVANFAQGAAELVGGPAQLLGAQPGPAYQQAEKEPQTLGDKAARFAGATLPLAPLSAGSLLGKADALSTAGAAGALDIPIGAASGAAAPAQSRGQRAFNTGLGALTGGASSWAPGSMSALDHLAGAGLGGMLGHGAGGGWGTLLGMLGGERIGGHIPLAKLARAILLRLPPSVGARAAADVTEPIGKATGEAGDYMTSRPGARNGDQTQE